MIWLEKYGTVASDGTVMVYKVSEVSLKFKPTKKTKKNLER